MNTLWQKIPASVQSYLVSLVLTAQSVLTSVLVVAWGLGLINTPDQTIHFFMTSWWTILLGVMFGIGPYFRAHQNLKSNSDAGTINQPTVLK